ncbi:MAG TPA: hypothetical protein VEX35_00325 [Allosphingosinicella sp.]|nr:hypothetical protein [Allosphingosinicella sp.]
MGTEETGTATPDGARTRKSRKTGRSGGETIFLVCMIVGTLVAAIGFVIATIVWNLPFPSTFVAILMGLCVATLAYTFLGGVDGAVFRLGGIQLAGSVAVIAAIIYLVKGPMAADMNDARAIQKGQNAISLIEQEETKTAAERQLRRQAERRLQDLQGESGETQATTVSGIVARIHAATARSSLGRGVLNLFTRGLGPFNPTLETMPLAVRFNDTVRPGSYRYCHSRRGDDFDGRPVRFEVVNREAGTTTQITLEPGDDFGQALCTAGMTFEIALGCDAVQALLPGATTACDARQRFAWIPPYTERNYDVVATILNPDVLPRSSVGSGRQR